MLEKMDVKEARMNVGHNTGRWGERKALRREIVSGNVSENVNGCEKSSTSLLVGQKTRKIE